MSLGVATSGRNFTAKGTVTPQSASAWELGLAFQSSTAPSLTTTPQTSTFACNVLAANLPGAAAGTLEEAIVAALDERAKQLSCMACRSGTCPEGIACVDR
ncbi:MAG: hypothetical protein QM784_14195 [Polyangiaceae bacterium]